jgi:hypothetical protein
MELNHHDHTFTIESELSRPAGGAMSESGLNPGPTIGSWHAIMIVPVTQHWQAEVAAGPDLGPWARAVDVHERVILGLGTLRGRARTGRHRDRQALLSPYLEADSESDSGSLRVRQTQAGIAQAAKAGPSP